MRRNHRLAGAVLGFLALAAVLMPSGASAQVVSNAGPFSIQGNGGQLRIGSLVNVALPASTALPQCSDGADNDGDGLVDLLDPNCDPGPNGEPASQDDSEIMDGFQPKVNTVVAGTVDANGDMTIPMSSIVFPPVYVPLKHPVDGSIGIARVDLVPTAAATGHIDPDTGSLVLNANLRAKISGEVWGNFLEGDCSVGTTADPIKLRLTTASLPGVNGGGPLAGTPYNQNTGRASLVSNDFVVPPASNCFYGFFGDISGAINNQMQLPSPAGKNMMYLPGVINPVLKSGPSTPTNPVPVPRITTNPATLTGDAPFTVGFSGSTSTVEEGPGTYAWNFGDGTTATGVTANHTYTTPGTYTATLTVTDTSGDSASTTVTVTVNTPPLPVVTARIATTPTNPTGVAPFTVGFNASASAAGAAPTTYAWSFGDGATGNGVSVNHTYDTPGIYTAKVTVTDANGTTDSATVTVEVTAPPTPELIARITTTPTNPTGNAPLTVTFSGSSSTIEAGVKAYTWDFGDGSASVKGVSATHTYETAGIYTARLTVTDTTDAADTATVKVTVNATPVDPGDPDPGDPGDPGGPTDPVSDDSIAVRLTGSFNYNNAGSGTGNVYVNHDDFGLASVGGSLEIPSAAGNGQKARVTVSVQRVWILPLWVGELSISDNAARTNLSTPIIGSVQSSGATPATAGSTMSWFTFGEFPDLFRPYTLTWSVTDAG